MPELPAPQVVRRFVATRSGSRLPALELRWDRGAATAGDRTWFLPGEVRLVGPPPDRFGLTLHRHGADSYRLQVLWDRVFLAWDDLSRTQVVASSLPVVLGALGTDLGCLLDQPAAAAPAWPGAA